MAETPENLEARFIALSDAIGALDSALSDLSEMTEKQADTIGGVVLVLRAMIDVVMDEDQRLMLERHLAMTAPTVTARTRRLIIEALLA
jgi:hypothetical protein